ncbi:MAG: phosphomannomutase/phosphoglucomutase [Methylococcaceae bacterium]
MERLFFLLAVIVMLMILAAGGSIYWMSTAEVAQIKQDSAVAVVKATALSISEQIELFGRALDKMALDPEVLNAVSSADPVLLASVAANLEKHLPDALKIRLLLPGVSDLDVKSVPRMGFADLDMVRETLTADQPPAIQGDNGPDRHLAMTRRIMQHGQPAGIILASLSFDFIRKSLQAAAVKDGYIELKQAKLVLGASVDQRDTGQRNIMKAKVANTDWEIYYHYDTGTGLDNFILIASFITFPVLIALLALFVVHRKLSDLVSHDLGTIMMAFKDMMINKAPGSYPVKLSEMKAVVSSLVQFKRVMNNNNGILDNGKAVKQDETFGVHDDLKPDDLLPGADLDFRKHITKEDQSSKQPADSENAFKKPAIITESLHEIIETPANNIKTDELAFIFRAYDIRGIAGETLTRERVCDIGRALGTDAKKHDCKKIVIARDGRKSSPLLAEALAQGIVSTGCNVLDIGMVPTPVLYFVARHTEGRSGVMLTGSHNPAAYNGLKMVINGETLAEERIQQLRQCIDKQSYAIAEAGAIEQNTGFVNEYIGAICEDIRISRPMLIVLDCGNGVAGELGPVLLKALGCEVIELFCDVDGSFPNHHPDPSRPENLDKLIASVKHYKADLGIAFDGDGDRLGVIDSNGKIIWPDRQMMLFAKDVLAARPGSEIIYDVKCTRHLADQIIKYGGRPVMWKTGHSLMKAKLKETGAALAGEMSGHICFNDRWFGFDDALYSAARLIEILSNDSRSSAEIFAEFPDSINTPELNIELSEGENFRYIESLLAEANFPDGKMTTIDGMRVDFSNGWGLVRASNTTPSLVIRFEADSKEALVGIQEKFRQLLKKIKPDIQLPF